MQDMHSMAIKINVSPQDQEAINNVLEKAGYARQRRKFHCTVGFIGKTILPEESINFGQKITQLLQAYIDTLYPRYEVEKVEHLFGHVIAFLPTPQSSAQLKQINSWLFGKVKEISGARWTLNEETFPTNYTPHLTLWRTQRLDNRATILEEMAASHPSYFLSNAAYVIFN